MKPIDYLKSEYHDHRHWGLNDRTQKVLEYFEKYVDKDASILELGCSSGRNLVALHEHGYKNLTGLEMYPVKERDEFKLIRNRYENIELEEYDVVFSASFIQEFEEIPVKELTKTLEKTKKYFMIFGDLIRNERVFDELLKEWTLVEKADDNAFSQPIRIYAKVN